MISALLLTLCMQNPAPKVSVLGKEKPARATLKPGDVVRVDTGIPNTGVPAIELWDRNRETSELFFSELEYWTFRAALETKEPIEQLHFMGDRQVITYIPNGTLIRIVAIHQDWGGTKGPLKDVPVAEIAVVERTGWVTTDAKRIAQIDKAEPVPKRMPFTRAVPLPYLETAEMHHAHLATLPILRVAKEKHIHKYCKCDEDDVEPHRHIDAVWYSDAEREWKERRRRSEEIKKRGEEEAKRRASERQE